MPYAQDVVDVALPDKRQDRFLGKGGPLESVHEQISIAILCALFNLSRKLSSSILVPGHMHRMSSM